MNNESLDPLYAEVFINPENGTPDNITQAGCLVLARLGKVAWNAWREKYPVRNEEFHFLFSKNCANFRRCDFSNESISFHGFIFGGGATFQEAKFFKADFEEAQFGNCTNFSHAKFHALANFSSTKFGDETKFHKAEFFSRSIFSSVQFGNKTSFSEVRFVNAEFADATFGNGTDFNGANIKSSTDFVGAEFGSSTEFISTQFYGFTKFSDAKFIGRTNFLQSKFNVQANFIGTQFCGEVCFMETQFGSIADFKGAQFGNEARFDGAHFRGCEFTGMNWEDLNSVYPKSKSQEAKTCAEKYGLKPDVFKSISFAGATFNGRADFSNRTFLGATSFGRFAGSVVNINGQTDTNALPEGQPVTFAKAPLFHGCKLHQDTTFDGAIFPPSSNDPIENDIAARAYRTLKLAFSQHQATYDEQRFFRLEIAEEAAKLVTEKKHFWDVLWTAIKEIFLTVLKFPLVICKFLLALLKFIKILIQAKSNSQRTRILLFSSYKYFSDYGFSFSRPLALLFFSSLTFFAIYTWLANMTPCWLTQADCGVRYDLIQFALLQTLPLPGLDKWSEGLRSALFPADGWKSIALAAALMLHKAISLLAVFLFGLALRNLFKMK